MEERLITWIDGQVNFGVDLNRSMITEMAIILMEDLCKQLDRPVKFKGSRGWFDKFTKRTGLVFKKRVGENLMVDNNVVNKFKNDLQKIIEEEGFTPEQVFNCDEAGLYWKKKQGKSFTTVKKNLSGAKSVEDKQRVTVLLGIKMIIMLL